MESRIKIKGTIAEVSKHFSDCPNPNYTIRSFDFGDRTRACDAVVRHKELKKRLEGTFTLKELDDIFRKPDDPAINQSLKIGDYVSTPRFLNVRISAIKSREEAREQGFTEPTDYKCDDYDVFGKMIGVNRMEFAAVKK